MRRLIVISGAGISAESGIRTFRTDTESGKALWDEYALDDVCYAPGFQAGFHHRNSENPPDNAISDQPNTLGENLYYLTHKFYDKRRKELPTVGPNLAHLRVAEWYNRFPGQVINLTTNVDDLFERAGVDRGDIIHVHGYLNEMRVIKNPMGHEEMLELAPGEDFDPKDYHWAKPNVVFFRENAPLYQDMYDLERSINAEDLVLVVGCSMQVIDFRWFLKPKLKLGAKVVEVNLYDAEAAQKAAMSGEWNSAVYSKSDMYNLDKAGILHWDKGAVDAFSDPKFIKMVEDHLEGKTCLQSK
ncbi:hypothetical protein pEaSNUABM55_00114 [Erwinia phage pEa_SNUABM_55]|nr:hypothetical protein pEaSNUABM55_00114 [Erwinia phage pEa_SNUABM_55]